MSERVFLLVGDPRGTIPMTEHVQLLLPIAVEPPPRSLPRVPPDGEIVEAMAELLLQALATEARSAAGARREVARDPRS
jgi:hypothetical protein